MHPIYRWDVKKKNMGCGEKEERHSMNLGKWTGSKFNACLCLGYALWRCLSNTILHSLISNSILFYLHTESRLVEEGEHGMDQDATEQKKNSRKRRGTMPTVGLRGKIDEDKGCKINMFQFITLNLSMSTRCDNHFAVSTDICELLEAPSRRSPI